MTTTLRPFVGKARKSVALSPGHRIVIYEGSVRSSKTVTSEFDWLRFVRTGPAGNLVMVGKTERSLKRNVIDPLIEMIGPKRCAPKWGDGELMLLGRRIYLAGANDEKAEGKIRGITLAGAYVDELSLIPESFWSMLLTRMSIEGACVFGTTNPDNPNHWAMRNYLVRARTHLRHDGTVVENDDPDAVDMNLCRLSFNLHDNPSLPAEYVRALTAQFTGLWRKRFIDGLWVMADGAIYDNFDTGVHVVDDDGLPEHRSLRILAIDYGTTNPFVALLMTVGVGPDGVERIYVEREWRWSSKEMRKQLTDAEYSKRLRAWLGRVEPDCVVVDPSAASFIAQLYTDGWAGIRKAKNAVGDGIRSTSSLFGAGRLAIHESCGHGHREEGGSDNGLIDELSGYVWDPKAAEKGIEQPVKVDDHGPDAARYGIMGYSMRSTWRRWLSELVFDEDEDMAA